MINTSNQPPPATDDVSIMKTCLLLPAILISVFAVNASAQQGNRIKNAPKLKWRVQKLHQDNYEGIAVGDIDGDGKLDVTAYLISGGDSAHEYFKK